MDEASGSEKEFRILVTDGVDLSEILLIVRSLVDESAAAEDLDVIYKTLQKCIVDSTLDVCVVTHASV